MIKARFARDTVGGLFFAAIGLAFVLGAQTLPMGEASRMASGYFPRLLGYCLIFLGLVISLKGTFSAKKPHEIIYRFDLKKLDSWRRPSCVCLPFRARRPFNRIKRSRFREHLCGEKALIKKCAFTHACNRHFYRGDFCGRHWP